MSELIRIEDVEVQKICYKDQPVLALADIDRVHERPEGTAWRNFDEHRNKFIFGVDYFDLSYEEWSVLIPRNSLPQVDDSSVQKESGGYRGNKIFMTILGYLMLVKSFKDEKAWRVQRLLVDSYFDLKAIQKAAKKDMEFEELRNKYIANLEKIIMLMEPKKKRVFSKISDEEMKQILEFHSQGLNACEIARRTGRGRSSISQIINYGRTAGRLNPVKQPEKSQN